MPNFLSSPDFISLLCGLAAFAAVVLVWTALIDNDPLEGRLKSITERRNEFEGGKQSKKNTHRAALQRVSLMKRVVEWFRLSQGKSLAELRLKLRRAGYQSRDAIFVFLFFKLAVMGGLAAGSFFLFFIVHIAKIAPALGLLIVLAAGLIGWLLPDVIVKNQSQKREDILRKAMPDALDLMVICAEAGLSLDASFDRVGREVGPTCPELAEEIGLTGVELNFLPDRHKALRGLAERVPLPSVLALANTLIQTEKYGTPLAQALRVLSAEMREERMMKAEEKAARLPAVLTVPMILFILPPLFVVLIGPAIIKVMETMAAAHQ
ncbi:MAG: type II secretion system F family protein [Alphaproteobacteria bacterium]|nr:type II secretion system F family protein [Alphaproteobacteria bacterium]